MQSGGLNSLDDYRVLYEHQWESSVPGGITLGAFQNATQDLAFSMERLSVNPYGVRRLHPTAEVLPFEVDPAVSIELAGADLATLHRAGRLFYVDHSYQAAYPTAVGKYTAACSAYFFLHPATGDFVPLAIKTNVGSNLTYTPLDTREDWLLAKAMFNANDLFHGQIFHLANSHAINEIVHLAALRTLSSFHPLLGLLNRRTYYSLLHSQSVLNSHLVMHHAYAIRPIGERFLFNDGGYFDQSFAITNQGVRMFATEFYPKTAGPFRANYFYTDLVARGLLNCTYGPALRSFPFFEDASVLHSAIHQFMASFVDAYYETEDLLAQDKELQSWVVEATSEALAIDFPTSPLIYKETLVDILTQIAFLSGVSHHVLNSGEPVTTSGILPLHPSAIYAPIPTEKGVKDLMPYMTPAEEAVKHVALLARFNRPQLEARNQTLLYMFSSGEFLSKYNGEIEAAASLFHSKMKAFSDEVRHREFDTEGLSQSMPFIWQALDPSRLPYFLSV